MWTNKSARQLTSERRARRRASALWALAMAFLLGIFALSLIGLAISTSRGVMALLAALALGVLFSRRARARRNFTNVWICDQCNRVKRHDDQTACLCGGRFLSMCHMKWLERPVPTDFRSSDSNPEIAIPAIHAA
jgi:hypothetical protein